MEDTFLALVVQNSMSAAACSFSVSMSDHRLLVCVNLGRHTGVAIVDGAMPLEGELGNRKLLAELTQWFASFRVIAVLQ